MEEYIKWLKNKIEVCLEDKDLQREHWAFCQALKKYMELASGQPTDEEIEIEANKRYGEAKGGGYHAARPRDKATFIKGAKWARNN